MTVERFIKLKNNRIKYHLKSSPNSRQMRLSVSRRGFFVLTVPPKVDYLTVRRFILSQTDWILERFDALVKINQGKAVRCSRRDYLKNKELARSFITARVEYFARKHRFRYGRISIRNQRTVWGSCSEDGNLNFNYILLKMPKDIADYIIVHELCHLRHFDHGEKFWQTVKEILPGYEGIRQKADEIIFM